MCGIAFAFSQSQIHSAYFVGGCFLPAAPCPIRDFEVYDARHMKALALILGPQEPRFHRHMGTSQFKKLAAEFETLKVQFSRCVDSEERVELLKKIGVVIDEIDGLIIEQLAKLQPMD